MHTAPPADGTLLPQAAAHVSVLRGSRGRARPSLLAPRHSRPCVRAAVLARACCAFTCLSPCRKNYWYNYFPPPIFVRPTPANALLSLSCALPDTT